MTSVASLADFAPLLASWFARASLIVAIALVAARLCERRSAALRHAILTAGIVASLALPLLASLEVTAFMPAGAADYPRGITAMLGGEGISPDPTLIPAGSPTPEPFFTAPVVPALRGIVPRDFALGAVVLVWMFGVVLLVVRRVAAAIGAHNVRQRTLPVSDAPLLALVREIAATQGLRSIPDMRASVALNAPATLGCWNPTILLPVNMLAWPAERLHPVLAHEVAHVARRDCLTTLLGDLANALYWCNPLVWLLTRRQKMERERACDDRALASGVDPTRYGLLLLDVARSAYGARLPASVLMMARPRELESRLLAIMSDAFIDRSKISRRAVIAITLSTALLGSAAAGHAASQPPRSRALEPDRRGDSVAHPLSEVLPTAVSHESLSTHVRASALWTGPDSLLVRQLSAALGGPLDTTENAPRRAAWVLSRARGDRIVPGLLATLGDADWRAQTMAAWTLAVAHEHAAVPGLITQLEHPVWRVRAMAAAALQHLGDSTALAALVRVLNDEAWQVRTPAVEFVAQHAEPTLAYELIVPRLRDRHVAVRRAASEALDALAPKLR